MDWKTVAQDKRRAVIESIPPRWRNDSIRADMKAAGFTDARLYLDAVLPEDENAITQLGVLELVSSIKAGNLTARAVTEAFCHRAALAHQIVNCCLEIFFGTALARADALDAHFARTGEVVGPLHGVPISLKDQIDLPGLDSAIGYVSRIGHPKTAMAPLAQALQDLGAVFYVKTTVPMAMMSAETVSNVHGYTSNARNIQLSSGGSSGGEGALIGAGGSPLGFGTDIGGSIRAPAAFQGLCGLKPSMGRLSYMNVTNSWSGQGIATSVVGPLGQLVADLRYVTQLVVDQGLWKVDPAVVPLEWKPSQDRKYTFGIWRFNGRVMPHPPILRCLSEAADALKAAGHEIVDIEVPHALDMLEVMLDLFVADGGRELEEECAKTGEPVVPLVAKMVGGPKELSVTEFFDVTKRIFKLRQEFAAWWAGTGSRTESGRPIDGIIAPTWPAAACSPHSQIAGDYTCPFNCGDCACAIVPVGQVDAKIDTKRVSYTPINELDDVIFGYYDPELYDKQPVCVQVVAPRLHEELVLDMAEAVERAMAGVSGGA